MYQLTIYYLVPKDPQGEWKKSKRNYFYKTRHNLCKRMEMEAKYLFSFYADVRFEVFRPLSNKFESFSREDILRRFPGE